MKLTRDEARRTVWEKLRVVGKADSRFGWNFAEFIADYEGSEKGAELLRNHIAYQNSKVVFITPDNNLGKLREFTILDRKTILMTSYGISRGLFIIRPEDVPVGEEKYLNHLDGCEKYMVPTTLAGLKSEFGSIDMLVTGASVMTLDGVRFGKGHGYFDIEWAMFWDMELVDQKTPLFGVGHDCQVVDVDISPTAHDTVLDFIVTPTKVINVNYGKDKPTTGIMWGILSEGMLENIPPLQELKALKLK